MSIERSSAKIRELFARGVIVASKDFHIQNLPDGRQRAHFRGKLVQPVTSAATSPPAPDFSCDEIMVTAADPPVFYDLLTITTQTQLSFFENTLNTPGYIDFSLLLNGDPITLAGDTVVRSDSAEERGYTLTVALAPGDIIGIQVVTASDTSEGVFYAFNYCLYFDGTAP